MTTALRIAVALERIANHLDRQVQTYDVKEAATILGLSTDTVYGLAKSGRLTSTRVGRRYKFTRNDLDRYLEPPQRLRILK